MVHGPDEIRRTVRRLGSQLGTSHGDDTVFVSVLKGSLLFLSDLVRAVPFHPVVDFLAVSPYPSGRGRVRLTMDLQLDIEGRDVVLVEDVIDSGLSLSYLRGELHRRGPRSLEVCTLVDKPSRHLVPVEVDQVGITVPSEYVIGYGLDFRGRYRNLDLLASADPTLLAHDPDHYVEWAYSRRRGGAPRRAGAGDVPEAPRR